MINQINFLQGYQGKLHKNALDINLIRNEKFYLVNANGSFKPVEGKNLRSFLDQPEIQGTAGEIKGYFDEEIFTVEVVKDLKHEKGEKITIDKLPFGRFDLRLKYDNVSTIHRNIDINGLILNLLLNKDDIDNAYITIKK